MKLKPKSPSIPPQISESEFAENKVWEHPWNAHMKKFDAEQEIEDKLNRPKPPTRQAVDKAKFKDKTYTWNGR